MNPTRRKWMTVIATSGLGMSLFSRFINAQQTESDSVIRITAKRFVYTPDTITLKKDVPVVFELTSEDVLMGFNLPDFKVRTDIVPLKTAQVRFTPDRVGTFDFYCDVFCGSGHEEMSGSIIVTA
ncbi:MAG TPA: cupredoxin domain-containing protein [Rhodocyclaceae bacterium]|nr:cupredoxin domain-containing protein [Rhodocyclaceae bacterium]